MKKASDNIPRANEKQVVKTSEASHESTSAIAAHDKGNDINNNEAEDAVKQNGNHSQPLQKDAVRIAAAAEQTKLQRDPDALPATGFPTKRDPASAAKNNEDPVLPDKSRGQ
jgi:hypothetical protein